MTSELNTAGRRAGKASRTTRELAAADGFGPLDSSAFPRAHETVRVPCLAGRWFSPRPRRTEPCLTTLAPKLVND